MKVFSQSMFWTKAALPVLFILFSMFSVSWSANDTVIAHCIKGEMCQSSADCCGAECSDGACLCSTTACITSGECCVGYCENGFCRDPTKKSLYVAEPLRRGMSLQFGCIGLVDKCSNADVTCMPLCTMLSGVFLLISFGFGVYAWKSFKHPVYGIISALVPISIGVLTYPFVGIAVGVVLLGLLRAR